MFLHGGRPWAGLRGTVAPQIRNNQPISLRERRRHRLPEAMIGRKRMQQEQRRAIAPRFIKQLDIAAAQLHSLSACLRLWLLDLRCGHEVWFGWNHDPANEIGKDSA